MAEHKHAIWWQNALNAVSCEEDQDQGQAYLATEEKGNSMVILEHVEDR